MNAEVPFMFIIKEDAYVVFLTQKKCKKIFKH